MNIKYLNICLDKEQFMRDTLSEMMPEMPMKEIDIKPLKRIIRLCALSVIMLIVSVAMVIKDGDYSLVDILAVAAWASSIAVFVIIYKAEKNCLIRDSASNDAATFMNSLRECAITDMTFDKFVKQYALLLHNDKCRIIWLAYNDAINNIEYIDNKVIFHCKLEDEIVHYELSEFYDKNLSEYNTVSVTKDGIFLGMYNDVLPNAIKSIIL